MTDNDEPIQPLIRWHVDRADFERYRVSLCSPDRKTRHFETRDAEGRLKFMEADYPAYFRLELLDAEQQRKETPLT